MQVSFTAEELDSLIDEIYKMIMEVIARTSPLIFSKLRRKDDDEFRNNFKIILLRAIKD